MLVTRHEGTVLYRFEDFELDTDRYELRRGARPVAVEPQVFGVLTYLVERADRVVRKEDILGAVWGTTFVSDAALSTRIKQARQALGDDGREQRLIKTVQRRGYRFAGEVSVVGRGGQHVPITGGGVRFCQTSDGARVAYATTGSGPPFVKAANWLTHLEYDDQSPVWRHLIRDLSQEFTLVRYDQRGSGLSDSEIADEEFSLEAWLRDLEAVVDALQLERFPLLGISQGGAVAIAYAVAHPERVSHLILQGAYARGRSLRGPDQAEVSEAIVALTRAGWGDERSEFARMFAGRMIPRGRAQQVRWLVELQRISTSRENAVRFRRAFAMLQVEDLLPRVAVPTLVLHTRGDQTAPFEEGRRLAAGIPGARLVALDSDNHLVLEDEPAWPQMLDAIREFVRGGSAPSHRLRGREAALEP